MKHCIEPGVDLGHATWRKSSFSGDQGNCVEVADGVSGRCAEAADGVSGRVRDAPVTLVRDSKAPAGPRLAFGAGAWASFLMAV
ncbi:DUF397 domain-containing protein [Streptomyces sp. NBC_01317]|uniref:DUF397 domain-containing protein n=1 Tax=Streptomyces sp. NBC_01317 TaxID=2903822 RepID=UPI002E122341|nr:DUF397 domain-containing protein [Streptomyces sp. NBC_01317]